MANILYRQSTTATLPVATSAKGSPLTNLEIDGNMRAMNEDLGTKATTSQMNASMQSAIDTAVAMAIALG